jgi:hypothetical protein
MRTAWGKTAMILGAVASAAALSGCASNMNAADAATLIGAFHAAGCGGSVDVDIQGGSGQLGGQGSVKVRVVGDCPVGDYPAEAPAE